MSKPFLGFQSPPEPPCVDEELEEWFYENKERLDEFLADAMEEYN